MRNNDNDLTKNADITKTNEFIKDKAILTPKWNLHINQQTNEPDIRASPSRGSPAVARKISATAQSVLGGVKSFLMPASNSSFNQSLHPNGAPVNTSMLSFYSKFT